MEIPEGYKIKHVEQPSDISDEMIQYLQKIIMDRTIPEENKVEVRKQMDEIIRMKQITMKPVIMLERE